MAVKAISLVQGVALTTSPVAQYTCPALQQTIVRHAVFANTTGTTATLTVNLVPSGGTLGQPNTIIPGISIPANSSYTSSELSGLVMNSGDTLNAQSGTGAAIAFSASGIAQT